MQAVAEDWERAVAIVAHPDDLEYGAAGSAVARWTAQGKEVAYVLATAGEAGIDGMAPDEAATLRAAEQRASARVGVSHVEFLGHADGAVEPGLALRRDLAGALRRLRPEVVLTMNFELTWGDGGSVNHADHRAVGLSTLDACRDAANRWMFPELGDPWQGITVIYVAGTSAPTHFVDVTATMDDGVASLREHKAYIDGLGTGFDPDEFLRNIAGYGGMAAGCEYAVLVQEFHS